ncbi:MAG TPA: LacI family DNA-binding transcriptional regulator [Propionibacteriaceae bacterium]|nr:LacI family DNA-binding transcriptional regulator [Propionibacteriaceae bacterium]
MTMTTRESRGVVMVDVARLAGVSQKTVSRVINDAPHVRPEIRDRVLAAIAELGYRPNLAARALVTQRTHVIGLLVVGTPLYGPAQRVFSLEQAGRELGYELALASLPDTTAASFSRGVQSLLKRGVEGIILEVPTHLTDVDDSTFGGLPVVTSVERIPGVTHQAVVNSSQREAGRLATQHLLDLGHETVFHIAGPLEWDASQQRRDGWSDALAAARRPVPPLLVGDWSARSGFELGQHIAGRKDLTAVFAANDHQAIGLMRALVEAGRSIPDDVSVVGFDDVPEAEFQMVPLTTVRMDSHTTSRRVLAELVALIEHGKPESDGIDVPCELVVRRSSGPPRADRHHN